MNPNEVRRNQHVLAEVNERIAFIRMEDGEGRVSFMCECGRAECTETIALDFSDYQASRASPVFLVSPGHCVEGVDRLIDSRPGYDVVVQEG